jgi:hypothetical protein
MTMWRMRITCWIPMATNTRSVCVILIAFPLQQWLHERASILRYTYVACLVLGLQTAKAYLTQNWLNNVTIRTRCPGFESRRGWRLVFGTKSEQILAFTHSPFQLIPYHISSRIRNALPKAEHFPFWPRIRIVKLRYHRVHRYHIYMILPRHFLSVFTVLLFQRTL